jgi:hypothetical protein
MTAKPKRQRRTKAQLEQARRRREATRKRNLKVRHNMTPEQYDELLAFQNGLCYICRRAKGTTRALSVDHDHAIAREICTHEHDKSCINCWRGLPCATCNKMLGHARDDVMFFVRAILYLLWPPARRWRGEPFKRTSAIRKVKEALQDMED